MHIKTNTMFGKETPPTKVQRPQCSTVSKKYILITATTFITVLLIVAGFVVAFYCMNKISMTAIQSKKLNVIHDGEEMSETIDRFSDDVFRYTIVEGGRTSSIIEDFSRRTVVFRKNEDGFQHCVILPMVSGQEIYDFDDDTNQVEANSTEKITYRLGKTLIRNHNLMSDVAVQLCEGYPLFWGTLVENTGKNYDKGRAKRDVHCTGCICLPQGEPPRLVCYCDVCHPV